MPDPVIAGRKVTSAQANEVDGALKIFGMTRKDLARRHKVSYHRINKIMIGAEMPSERYAVALNAIRDRARNHFLTKEEA